MSLTKSQADAELIDRTSGLLAIVGKSVVVDGTNPDTVGALREGLASLGLGVATFGAVADADLAAVPTSDYPQLFDVAELRLLRNIRGSLTLVDQKISLGEQKLGQVRDGLNAAITDLEAKLKCTYGIGAGTVSGGAVDLGFAQTDPCDSTPLWGC